MFRLDMEIIKNETEFSNEVLYDEIIYEETFCGLNGRATFKIKGEEVNGIWNLNECLEQIEFEFDDDIIYQRGMKNVENLIIDLKVNESSDNFDLSLHEELLYKLFNLGISLEEIGILKGEI